VLVHNGALRSARTIPLRPGDLSPLVREVRRLATEVAPPEPLFLNGGSEADRQAVASALGVPVTPWEPGETRREASTFGLALSGVARLPLRIDLLASERGDRRDRAVTAMALLLVLVGILGAAWGVGSALQERRLLSRLIERSAAVKAQAAEVERLKAEVASMASRRRMLEAIGAERGRTMRSLKALTEILPVDVTLSELHLDGNRLQIRGSTGGSAPALISAFERSAIFENAAFTSPIAAQGKDRHGFHLQAFVKAR
jgi:Tfp pilus assembly protein PilN